MRKGQHSLDAIIIEDVPTTLPDTPLVDLLPVASTTTLPIAVVDETRKLQGVIVRAAILAGIGGDGVCENREEKTP